MTLNLCKLNQSDALYLLLIFFMCFNFFLLQTHCHQHPCDRHNDQTNTLVAPVESVYIETITPWQRCLATTNQPLAPRLKYKQLSRSNSIWHRMQSCAYAVMPTEIKNEI